MQMHPVWWVWWFRESVVLKANDTFQVAVIKYGCIARMYELYPKVSLSHCEKKVSGKLTRTSMIS